MTKQIKDESILRIAIPNKGSLSLEAVNLLKQAGYQTRRDDRQLVLFDEQNGIEFFYLRPKDIAVYVGNGIIDAGITGRDLALNSKANCEEVVDLKFAASKFCLAVQESSPIRGVSELEGLRIATSLTSLLENSLEELGVKNCKIVYLDGAVESSIKLGVADLIADVVSTGTTLKQAGLRIIGEPLLKSSAIFVKTKNDFSSEKSLSFETLKNRLLGIVRAKENVLIDFDIPTDKVKEASRIAPGFAAPTISEIGEKDGVNWSAMRVMIQRSKINEIMDSLYELGARAVLATEIITSRI